MATIVRRQERHRTAAAWVTANEVLLLAELGVESDTGKLKVGDGTTAWNSLAYIDAKALSNDGGLLTTTGTGGMVAKGKIAIAQTGSPEQLGFFLDGAGITGIKLGFSPDGVTFTSAIRNNGIGAVFDGYFINLGGALGAGGQISVGASTLELNATNFRYINGDFHQRIDFSQATGGNQVFTLPDFGAAGTFNLATRNGAESLTNKKLGSLTTNGLVTTSNADGTLFVTPLGTNVANFLSSPSGSALAAALTTALPASKGGTGLTALGNAVATALGVAIGSPGAMVINGGALGTPSSGTLSGCTVDGTNAPGPLNVPQNSQSANYTLVIGDAGKHILHPSADGNARTFTIPANATVAFPIGTAVTFINETTNALSIGITTDSLVLANSTTTGTRTLAQNGIATAVKVTATKWIISGNGLS